MQKWKLALAGTGIALFASIAGYEIGVRNPARPSSSSVKTTAVTTPVKQAATPTNDSVMQMIKLMNDNNRSDPYRLIRYLSAQKPDAKILNRSVAGHGMTFFRRSGDKEEIFANNNTPITILDAVMDHYDADYSPSQHKTIDRLRAMGAKPSDVMLKFMDWDIENIQLKVEDYQERIKSDNKDLTEYRAALAYWKNWRKQVTPLPGGAQ